MLNHRARKTTYEQATDMADEVNQYIQAKGLQTYWAAMADSTVYDKPTIKLKVVNNYLGVIRGDEYIFNSAADAKRKIDNPFKTRFRFGCC